MKSIKYSTFKHTEDNLAVLVEEPWDDFAVKLLTHTITPNKPDVALFNTTLFGGSNRRKGSCAVEVSAVILDVDNKIKQGHPGYEVGNDGKAIPKRITQPLEPYEVEGMLYGREFVLYSTHSHTDHWPRFRVVLPLASPVPIALWKPFAETILAELGLLDYAECIDDCSPRPVQMYYWPTHAEGAAHYAARGTGTLMTFDAAKIQSAAVKGAAGSTTQTTKTSTISLFTTDQIAAFWAYELPEMDQPGDGNQWDAPTCVLHGGSSAKKFYVNPANGLWYCQSGCEAPNKGGDVYKFVMLRHDKTFPEAKQYVHEITGDPTATHTVEQLVAAIETADGEDVNTLIAAIAQQPKKQQAPLKQQLITTLNVDPDTLNDQIADLNKVVRFRSANPDNNAPIEPNAFGLTISDERYEMRDGVIWQMRQTLTPKGPRIDQMTPPLTDRPIWPEALGFNLATGQHCVKLSWHGSQGFAHTDWYPEGVIRQKDQLLKLDDAPISIESVGRISSWLTYAKTCVAQPMREVTTEIGWTGVDDEDRRFIMPNDQRIEYIGKPTTLIGNIDDWAIGLKDLLRFGPDAYRALVALGMCAGSPLVRLVTKRNPILGMVAPSGSGKNKVLEYGLSIWDKSDAGLLVATAMLGASAKGVQDRAHERSPDLPIFVDELQQLAAADPALLEAILYWMGSGKRRVTSTKIQVSTGGELRYAANLWAAENNVVQGLQAGAQNRTIVMEGLPFPANQSKTVALLETAGRRNVGVVGRSIVALLNNEHRLHVEEIEHTAFSIVGRNSFSGDDHYSIAIAMQGLRLLSEVTRLEIDIADVQEWFVDELSGARGTTRDRDEDTFTYLVEALMGMAWDAAGVKDVLQDPNGGIAWRKSQAVNPAYTPLEINPTHPVVVELLKRKGGKEAIGHQWGKKGWLHSNGSNAKRVRSKSGVYHAGGAYAWRITIDGLAKLGLDADFNPVKKDD